MNQQPYVVGKWYTIPVAVVFGYYDFHGLKHVPIIGPEHNDKAIVDVDGDHLHVDWRFVSDNAFWLATAGSPARSAGIVVNAPVIDRTSTRRMKCVRDFAPYPYEIPGWLPALETAYADHALGPKRICPHKGADLSTIAPDENGLLTCPLHGLSWNTKTGCLHRNRAVKATNQINQ